ncbi:DUF4296 domain-containing protein [Pareuzebyella sediminis]|uniref:DUF4296 domain-containing protein n=1 Tax=Pareuzebyella sediminis TaxID=2607998 RepID=UPI001E57103B|nr:DUF4296 domain-containing protein [Pareuzebyella sediminis]
MKNSFSFVLIAFFMSCNEQLMEKPDRLIPRDKMVSVLKDLALVNAAKTTNITRLREKNLDPMVYVFEKYDIDSVQFVESDRYYASLPVEYEKIYQEVEAEIQKDIDVLKEAEARQDSLERLEYEARQAERKAANQAATDSLP